MDKNYKPITSMKEVPEQLRKLRRQYLRYQQAEIIYSISHKKLFELASDAGAIYRIDGTVLINHDNNGLDYVLVGIIICQCYLYRKKPDRSCVFSERTRGTVSGQWQGIPLEKT